MIPTTLLKLGEWQSKGRSEWYRFLNFPKIEYEDKDGNPIRNYTFSILLDLDNKKIIIDPDNLRSYSESDVEKLFCLNIKGGNNKAAYSAVEPGKFIQIYKTFFGKENTNTDQGELKEAINKLDSTLLTSEFKEILNRIFSLKSEFVELFTDEKSNGEKYITFKKINSEIGLGKNDNIVIVNVLIKFQSLNQGNPTYFSDILEYRSFLEKSYLSTPIKISRPSQSQVCYVSGTAEENVDGLSLNTRYSINKMFVTETKNYANNFDDKKFKNNYQISQNNQAKLDLGSDYLLNNGYTVTIAGVKHVIIPHFGFNSEINYDKTLKDIDFNSDLLFNLNSFENFSRRIERRNKELYWISYLSFESDGNFFKTTGEIKDVSSFHLHNLIETFFEIDQKFREFSFVDWQMVMTEYKELRGFNFNSIYGIIPQRKDKEKKNRPLELFKSILEGRVVRKANLYDYFTELILCHYYQRYKSYTNIRSYDKEFLYFAVRDSVYKYLAFIKFLQQLNLIDMDEHTTIKTAENNYEKEELHFFKEMGLNDNQKAMFYLGRMLNKVEYMQREKNRTVIQKVNFDGMDRDDIERLRLGLIEKAKQYNEMKSVIFIDQKFVSLFNFNAWEMNPKEAVFFLLSGYSFMAKKNEKSDNNNE
ncbi:MAG: TM1802 family CRISPR-associated protein [Flavobacteriaceae bacterium]|nr:TM1802 family CRISPR-associated protein [Flavobacteriaceae bacterium]